MPLPAVKSVRQIIYYQYAKIIASSSGFGKAHYGMIMSKWKDLCAGTIHWSSSVREWVREREHPGECIYCDGAYPAARLRGRRYYGQCCQGMQVLQFFQGGKTALRMERIKGKG